MKLDINTQSLSLLVPEISGNPFTCSSNSHILVTGGAGFLGIHLLRDLVECGCYDKIYTIVRNPSKLISQAAYYGIFGKWLESITVIKGDLLNLPENLFPDVEHVLHSAAEIHCLKNRNQLWSNNVLATQRIAEIYRLNKISFISTLSVFVSSNQKGLHLPQSIPLSDDYSLYGGYAQTKFIGEKIIEKVHGNIIRLGLITGSTHSGIFPADFFTQIVKLLELTKCYPVGYQESFVDMTPVDYASQEILKAMHKTNTIVHIANKDSTSINTFISELNLKPVDRDVWLESIKSLGNLEQYLLRYAFFKDEMLSNHFNYFNLDLFQSTGHQYGIEKSLPIDNETMLKLYISSITERVFDSNLKI